MLKVDITHRHVADAPRREVERRDIVAIVHVAQPMERAVLCSSRQSATISQYVNKSY